MHYYGTRLSENISRREPEGYLLCLNVPVARTGTQDYLPEELGLGSGPGMISVFRPETEVFAPETIASFEGMPVTNDHPPDGVDIENIRRLQMGHAHNIRRGTGEEADLLLADLIITDERLIDLILSGKREISCGYTYELAEENGQYFQRKIRGNHIAVVDAGRAGPRVCIKDRKPDERRTGLKKSLTKLLARMARDGDVETVAEFIEEMIGEETPGEAAAEVAEAVAETAEAPAEPVIVEAPEAQEITIDEETCTGILERLDKLIALLTPAAGDEDPGEEIAEVVEEVIEAVAAEEAAPEENSVPAEEEVAEILEEILEPEVSTTLEEADEDDPEEPDCTQDALRAALTAMRPALSRMSRKQRKKACADIAARLKNQRRNVRDGSAVPHLRNGENRPFVPGKGNPMDLGKRIMASRNPNYRK